MEAGGSAEQEAARSRRQAEELRRRAEWHERRAAAFAAGGAGEQAVARQLDALQSLGWHRLDDRRWPGRARANLDHVVIGPPGVFVIDAKNWSGPVLVRAGQLRQRGHLRNHEVAAAAAAARAVAMAVAASPGMVRGALCMAGGNLAVTALADDVLVGSGNHLVRWLRRQPRRLTDEQVRVVADRLSAVLTPASRPAPPAPAPAVASWVPDTIPPAWTLPPARHEPSAAERRRQPATGAATATGGQPRRHAALPQRDWLAIAGRVGLLVLTLDACATALTAGPTVAWLVGGAAGATLVRVERRRPLLLRHPGRRRR